eukprot:g18943.t1
MAESAIVRSRSPRRAEGSGALHPGLNLNPETLNALRALAAANPELLGLPVAAANPNVPVAEDQNAAVNADVVVAENANANEAAAGVNPNRNPLLVNVDEPGVELSLPKNKTFAFEVIPNANAAAAGDEPDLEVIRNVNAAGAGVNPNANAAGAGVNPNVNAVNPNVDAAGAGVNPNRNPLLLNVAAAGDEPNLEVTEPWRGNAGDWENHYKSEFLAGDLFDQARQMGVISRDQRQAAGQLKRELVTNQDALRNAPLYGRFKHWKNWMLWKKGEWARAEFGLDQHPANQVGIFYSYISCQNNRYPWSQKQAQMLNGVCTRLRIDVNEFMARVDGDLLPEWGGGPTADLSPIR